MTKRTIAIDIDDVIADSTEALRVSVNERTGAALTRDHYLKVGGEYWGYYERVWRAHDLISQVSYKEYAAAMAKDQSSVPLLPGADLAIRELAKRFHIIFITARDKKSEQETRRWIREHFAANDFEVYFCESHTDTTAKTKGQLCKDFGASILIDDNVGHCQSALDENLSAILFGEYGWQADVPKGMVRCFDWSEVIRQLDYAA